MPASTEPIKLYVTLLPDGLPEFEQNIKRKFTSALDSLTEPAKQAGRKLASALDAGLQEGLQNEKSSTMPYLSARATPLSKRQSFAISKKYPKYANAARSSRQPFRRAKRSNSPSCRRGPKPTPNGISSALLKSRLAIVAVLARI